MYKEFGKPIDLEGINIPGWFRFENGDMLMSEEYEARCGPDGWLIRNQSSASYGILAAITGAIHDFESKTGLADENRVRLSREIRTRLASVMFQLNNKCDWHIDY